MKKHFLYGALAALLSINVACTAPAPANTAANANKPANANTAVVTNTNTAANAANTANTAASNTNAGAANSNSAAAASAAGAQDFKLINETGVEINALYVSPSNSDDWEEDILGQDTLAAGQSLDVKFNRDEKAAMWDLRVEDKAGNFIVWEDLNLLEINELTLNYKDGKATAIKK
jgi:hypothetical protein